MDHLSPAPLSSPLAPDAPDIVLGYDTAASPATLRHSGGTIALTPGADLAYATGGERRCTGYRTPAGDSGPCPDAASASVGALCARCAAATMLQPCITRCTGARCVNPERRASCVPVDHYVYLAYYADEVVKVGVTKVARFAARIAEQGALAAVAIHAAGGQDVRRVETLIKRAGYVDRTDVVPLLCTPVPDAGHVEQVLRAEAARIAVRTADIAFMTCGPLIDCTDRYPAPLPGPPRILDAGVDPLCGEVLGVRGGHLILRLPAFVEGLPREVGVLSLRSLLGRTIVPLAEDAPQGPQQAALCF